MCWTHLTTVRPADMRTPHQLVSGEKTALALSLLLKDIPLKCFLAQVCFERS